jgi:hypothetical protein
MGAKRYLLIVWLAFAVPWVGGTTLGLYKESQATADGSAAAGIGCAGDDASERARSGGGAECQEKALASLTGRALDTAGDAVQLDRNRSADSIKPVHRLADAMFILGPPLVLIAAYCLIFLAAGLSKDARQSGIGE